MTARIIDGTSIGRKIREEVLAEVVELKRLGVSPGLAAVLVGNNAASQVYVRSKIKACESLGIYSEHVHLSAEITTLELLKRIEALNLKDEIDGILVQLPSPNRLTRELFWTP
jgi:methylenetetrahydrofolate dehydrogenase (NADP+)/methenyltetrahydrofolate cyclohydrolase